MLRRVTTQRITRLFCTQVSNVDMKIDTIPVHQKPYNAKKYEVLSSKLKVCLAHVRTRAATHCWTWSRSHGRR